MKKAIIVVMALILGFNSFGQTSSKKKLEESINEVFESYAHYNRFIGNVLILSLIHISEPTRPY